MRIKLIYPILFILVLTATENTSAELIVHLKLDETSGNVASDSSGNGNDGALSGNPRWVVGLLGGALQFDGGDSVTLPASAMRLSSDVGSVAFWMNMGAPTEIHTIFWAGDNTTGGGFGPENEMHVHIENAVAGTWEGGELAFHGQNAPNFHLHSDPVKGGAGSTPVNPILMGDNQWHHVAATWGDADGNVKLYLDGELLHETAYGTRSYELTNIYLGQMANAGRTYSGLLDDVQIFNHALNEEEVLTAMAGGVPLGASSEPFPEDESIDISRDVVLTWEPGENVQTHDVYFGTAFDDVNDADRTNPLNVLVSQSQSDNAYDPDGRLELNQTHYWRVDEFDGTTIYTGKVWSFTVEPLAYPIGGERITAIASSSVEDKGPENTVNGSGLDDSGLLHDREGDGSMWLSSPDGEQPTWIEFEFDKAYKLHQMWIWNSNDSLEPVIGLGLRDVSIEYSLNGIDFATLGATHEFAQAPGTPDYEHNTTIEFNGAITKYVRLTANSNWGGILAQYGLSEVRFFQVPIYAKMPVPDFEATDVALDVILGWREGREAAEHNVYFSNDEQAVIDGTADVTTVTDNSYGPLSLDLGTTYYWRVDEVNGTDIWQGDVWNFTTHEYFVVDDFEDYNDYEPDRVFDTWIDGWDDPTNGSTIGYAEPVFADGEHFIETTVVHGGEQSMPYFYDNSLGNSEATMILSSLTDWTQKGIGTLTLWYIGDATNSAELLYVTLNGNATVQNDNPNAAQVTEWAEWSIDLQEFADQGVNLDNIGTITIGFGDNPPSGSGVVFFDDIRLYPSR